MPTSNENTRLPIAPLDTIQYEGLVRQELAVDLGSAGDITTNAIVGADVTAQARIVARQDGRVCGLGPALCAFFLLGPVRHKPIESDGADVRAGAPLVELQGSARVLLSAERTALNLLGHLSGVATLTRAVVDTVAEVGQSRVVCTRKTTPGLRTLEKYAVRVGGASNHRFGLHDAVLIKDNHRAVAGSVRAAVEAARASLGHLVALEIEVDTLEQLEEALAVGADVVLLDNMSVADLTRAVTMARGRAITEASGGITPETIREVAATGVDVISIGWITHSAPALDVALDFSVSA
jgi:nicotinate-nucleotide pyrophosphorylase (carboxylating)